MKKIIIVLFFLLAYSQTQYAQSAKPVDLYNPMSNNLSVTLDGGITLGQTDYRDIKIDYTGRGSLEYFFYSKGQGSFGLRGFGGIGNVSGKYSKLKPNEFVTNISYAGLGVIYMLSINDVLYPYASAGFSSLWYYPKDVNGNELHRYKVKRYDNQMGAYNGEVGLKYMVAENLSINLSGALMLGTKDYLDDLKAGSNNDDFFSITAGISFYFGRDKDSDNDGVPDYLDICPGTPLGVKVDATGCPLDSDGDGVPDYLDKCPNTPKGVQVDKNGCPLDSDGDGVPDYLDKCPDTPKGVQVDKDGCPLDSDGDGVPDYLDKCPDTPKGVQVDKNGCPLDSDGDGVPDYLDKCPNTPKGVQVDKNGCPIKKPVVIKSFTLSGDANFESGKADLLPQVYPVLDSLAITMKENPQFKWMVAGYTDAIGSAAINLKLSGKRAQAVVDYLVIKGVNRNKLLVKAYGKANPIANNNTAEGRAMNRRVEIKVIEENNK